MKNYMNNFWNHIAPNYFLWENIFIQIPAMKSLVHFNNTLKVITSFETRIHQTFKNVFDELS